MNETVSLLGLALSLPLALVMILIGFAKLQSVPASLAIATRLGVTRTVWQVWGAVDLVCAAGLILGAFAVASVAIAAALVVSLSMLTLLALQIRARDSMSLLIAPIALVGASVLDIVVLSRQ